MKRQFDPNTLELMDRSQPVSAELDRDLRNLRRLNRWFGSYLLISRFLRCWICPGATLRILDLATGSGDIPRIVADYAGADWAGRLGGVLVYLIPAHRLSAHT